MRFSFGFGILLLSLSTGCDDGSGPARPDAGSDAAVAVDAGDSDGGSPPDGGGACGALAVTEVLSGLSDPILVTAPDGDDRLFIVEIGGRIQIARGGSVTGTFLDLSGSVVLRGDHGLNGLAFHPSDGRVFVSYATGATTLRIASFTLGDADTVDPTSEQTILEVDYPEAAHTGGHLAFGPDGYLYIGIGDGEARSGMALAQDLTSLNGKILRIDVDGAAPYAIPGDNPFTGTATMRDEIYAYGFRLPYRFTFDGTDLIVGEVGNDRFEEVDLVTSGGNYGWPVVEGNMHCNSPASGCDLSSEPPIHEFPHSGGHCAMMGGHVYRGSALPSCYAGRYFYADYCSGQVTSFRVEGGAAVDVQDGPSAPGMVVSWGRGGDGELYLLGMDGSVYQLTAAP
ncbi:MAG: PQQ-dependent sugar dehydrogenase [Sandaracinaceae bacterium]|nr:PQQ-dependent sugar dehydrogenase [Sandaracinaceae bacterium]